MQILRRGAGGWVFFTYKISISIMILNGWYLMPGLWFLKSTKILIWWYHFTIAKFKKYIFTKNDDLTNFNQFIINIIILSYCVVIITSTIIQICANFQFLSWLLFYVYSSQHFTGLMTVWDSGYLDPVNYTDNLISQEVFR